MSRGIFQRSATFRREGALLFSTPVLKAAPVSSRSRGTGPDIPQRPDRSTPARATRPRRGCGRRAETWECAGPQGCGRAFESRASLRRAEFGAVEPISRACVSSRGRTTWRALGGFGGNESSNIMHCHRIRIIHKAHRQVPHTIRAELDARASELGFAATIAA